jgi:PAS domain S-box-containing protein
MYQKPVPLRLILVITFVLQTVAAVSLTLWLTWSNEQRSIGELSDHLRTETLARIQEKINHHLTASATINQVNIHNIVSQRAASGPIEQLTQKFWEYSILLPDVPISAIFFGRADGRFVCLELKDGRAVQSSYAGPQTNGRLDAFSVDKQGKQMHRRQYGAPYDPRQQPWYLSALRSQQPGWSAVHQNVNQPEPTITLSEAVYGQGRTLLGVVAVDFSLKQVNAYLRSLVTPRMPILLIIDRNGQLVANSTQQQPFTVHNGKGVRLFPTELEEPLMQGIEPVLRETIQQWDTLKRSHSKVYWCQGRPCSLWVSPLQDLRGLDLRMVAIVPQPTFFDEIPPHRRDTLLLCFVVLMTAILLGLITARRLSQGLQQFLKIGQSIVAGTPDQNFPDSRIAELNHLAQTFNQMALHVRSSFEELETRVEERTAALKQSEAKFARVFYAYPNPIVISRLQDGLLTDANDSATQFFGLSREALVGKTGFELGLEIQADRFVELVHQIPTHGPIRNLESSLVTPLGTRTILYSADLIEINNESYLLSIIDDITDRKQADEALRRSEEKFANFFHSNPNPMAISRMSDGCILEINRSALKYFGVPKSKAIGKRRRFSQIWANVAQRDQVLRMLQQFRGVQGFECGMRVRSGQVRTVLYSAELIEVDEQPCIISAINDISDRLQAEEALRQAKVTAEIANQAKSNFLSHMSHELRTPLNAILGFTQVMGRDASLSATQREQLDIINRSGEHLLEMINDVLDLAKIEAGRVDINRSSFDLYRLLKTLEQMFQMKASAKNVKLIFERSSQVPQFVETDAGKLRQVLINLIGNAIKFTDEGYILVQIHWAEGSQGITESRLYFKVEDTGTGIEPSEHNSIFQAFVQGRGGGRAGTGLGLSISREFIHLLGGEISVSSALGQGTTFSFDLPIVVSKLSSLSSLHHHEPLPPNPLSVQPLPNGAMMLDTLGQMPISWIKELHQAAMEINNAEIWQLMHQIPPEHQALKQALAHLVQNFRCDLIYELTRTLL